MTSAWRSIFPFYIKVLCIQCVQRCTIGCHLSMNARLIESSKKDSKSDEICMEELYFSKKNCRFYLDELFFPRDDCHTEKLSFCFNKHLIQFHEFFNRQELFVASNKDDSWRYFERMTSSKISFWIRVEESLLPNEIRVSRLVCRFKSVTVKSSPHFWTDMMQSVSLKMSRFGDDSIKIQFRTSREVFRFQKRIEDIFFVIFFLVTLKMIIQHRSDTNLWKTEIMLTQLAMNREIYSVIDFLPLLKTSNHHVSRTLHFHSHEWWDEVVYDKNM